MSRSDLERLSKEELIELVLRLHRPAKTSRNLTPGIGIAPFLILLANAAAQTA